MTDLAGRTVWQAEYDPFGKAVVDEDPDGDGQAVVNNLRFPGQYFDVESGLHYNYYRDYDPETGRYLQPDPIGLVGGLNLYPYVMNNPVNNVDPDGRLVVPAAYVAFTAAAGAAVGLKTYLQSPAGQQAIQDMRDLWKNLPPSSPDPDSLVCEQEEPWQPLPWAGGTGTVGHRIPSREGEVAMLIGKPILVLLTVGCLSPLVAATTEAEIYKWIDAQGNVHFQDHPPQETGKVSGLEVRDSSPPAPQDSAPASPAVAGSPGQPDVASVPGEPARATPRTAQVELYTVDWCPWCKKAREFFRSRGVAFTDYNVEKDAAAAARRNEMDPKRGIPLAVINGMKIKGYSPEAYSRALNSSAPGSP